MSVPRGRSRNAFGQREYTSDEMSKPPKADSGYVPKSERKLTRKNHSVDTVAQAPQQSKRSKI